MSDAMRFDKRMSDMDALMWGVEKDPLLRSTICAVAVLDQAPDRARLLDKIERGTRSVPRLRQRAVSPPFALAPPEWVVDANFDIDYHVRFLGAPGDGSMRALLDFAAPIAMQGFDRARPLWEFYVVEGLDGGRAALIQKIHHAVTDGVGGIQIALMLLDTQREAADAGPMPPAPEPDVVDPVAMIRGGLGHEYRRQTGIARRALGGLNVALREPEATARAVAATAASLGRLLAPAFEPLSPVMRERSLSLHFETIAVSLPDVKAAANAAGCRLNDAFVAAVAGGLARYHEAHGAPVDALRMSMPINIRDAEAETVAGNQFVPARFPIPLTIADPVERMQTMRTLVSEARAEPALAFTEPIAGVLNRLPVTLTTQLFGSMLKGIDVVTSNVPGLPFQVFMAGAHVEANFAFGPPAGAAVNVTLLSYVDELHIGINTDPAAVPDPDVLVQCLREGFDELIKSV